MPHQESHGSLRSLGPLRTLIPMPPSLAPRRAARLFVAAAGLALFVATLPPAGPRLAPGWDPRLLGGDDAPAAGVPNGPLFLPPSAPPRPPGVRTLPARP